MNDKQIDEGMIDHWIDEAVRFSKGSDTRLKFACRAASKVVGLYSDATQQIADRTKRSVSTVQNWAHAYWLVEAACVLNMTKAAMCWKDLPPSHWWLAYDKIHLAGFDALHYLENARLHSWSGRAMLGEFEKDREAGTAPLVFKRACLSFYGLSLELAKQWKQLNDKQRAAVDAVREAFEVKG